MAKLIATRTTQKTNVAEFVFNFNDYLVDAVSGSKVTLGSTVALAETAAGSTVPGLLGAVANAGIVIDAIPMPIGAVIVGGELIVETAVTGSTAYTVSAGIAGTATAFLNAVSALAAARTGLTITSPLLCNSGTNIRLTVAYTVANATAGKCRLRVEYTIDGKADDICVV